MNKVQSLEYIVLCLLVGRKVRLNSDEEIIVEDVYKEKIIGVGKNLNPQTNDKMPYIKFNVENIKYIYGVDEC